MNSFTGEHDTWDLLLIATHIAFCVAITATQLS